MHPPEPCSIVSGPQGPPRGGVDAPSLGTYARGMNRSELLSELERLRREAATARDSLQGLLASVRGLKARLQAETLGTPEKKTPGMTAPSEESAKAPAA
jgi:hypothetical protein